MSHRTRPPSAFARAVAAERFTAIATPTARILVAASMVMAAVSLAANLSVIDDLNADPEDTLRLAMHASTVATLVFALIAGVYSATTDHRFGLVDQRALSQPSRSLLLRAKLVIAAGTGLIYAALGALIACLAGTVYYSSQGASFDLTSSVVVRSLSGLLVAAPLFALLGVAVGTLVRNQPIALGGSLAWLLMVEPAIILGLPEVGRWLPGAAGLSLTFTPDEALLSQVAGGVLLAAIVAAVGLGAFQRFAQSDL